LGNIMPVAPWRTRAYIQSFAPLSEEDQAIIQARLDYLYTGFVASVAANRGISVDDQETWAEGRIFTGTQAIEAGLVDGVSTFDSLVESIASGELASTGAVRAEAEAKKKKEAAAKEAVERAGNAGALEEGAKQGRAGLGKHTRKLLEGLDPS
ncbi:hypothetical protein LCGC14_2907600, partial [marine sediment metagenome]